MKMINDPKDTDKDGEEQPTETAAEETATEPVEEGAGALVD